MAVIEGVKEGWKMGWKQYFDETGCSLHSTPACLAYLCECFTVTKRQVYCERDSGLPPMNLFPSSRPPPVLPPALPPASLYESIPSHEPPSLPLFL